MGFTLESHKTLKRDEKPLYCHFCATKNTRFRPLQLFSKQFLEEVFSETHIQSGESLCLTTGAKALFRASIVAVVDMTCSRGG